MASSRQDSCPLEDRKIDIGQSDGRLISQSQAEYLRADQRACVRAIENLWSNYAVTAKSIEEARDDASSKLQTFLAELGYE